MTAEQPGVVDYLCNAFTPDRRAVWDGAIAASGVQVKVRRDEGDGFAEPAVMAGRLEELGVDTVLLPTGDLGRHGTLDRFDFEHVAARWEEVAALAERWPGRFAALALIDPELGLGGVRAVRSWLAEP